jgi:hypothetical protein
MSGVSASYGPTTPTPIKPQSRGPSHSPLCVATSGSLSPAPEPRKYNIKTMPRRITRLKQDPFLAALTDQQRLEPAIPKLEGAGSIPGRPLQFVGQVADASVGSATVG